MKNFFTLLFVLALTGAVSNNALAQDASVDTATESTSSSSGQVVWELAGYGELNNAKFEQTNYAYDSRIGFGLGVLAQTHLTGNLGFRTGLGYTRYNTQFHSTTVGTSGGTTDDSKADMSYLMIPATVMLEVTPAFDIFGGLNVGVNVSKNCQSPNQACNIRGANTFVFNAELGLRFDVSEYTGVELVYQKGLSEMYQNTTLGSTFAGRFLYFF